MFREGAKFSKSEWKRRGESHREVKDSQTRIKRVRWRIFQQYVR